MSASYYQITITNPALSAPQDGFIDPIKLVNYATDLVHNPPAGLTLSLAQAKARGNARYDFLVAQLEFMTNVEPYDIVATGATATTEASPFSFCIKIDRGDAVLQTWDELNHGVLLTGIPALVRCVARGLIMTETLQAAVWDPTDQGTIIGPQSTVSGAITLGSLIPRFGMRIGSLTVGPLAASLAAAAAMVTIVPTTLPAFVFTDGS